MSSDILVLEIIIVRVLIQFDTNKFSSSSVLVLQKMGITVLVQF